MEWTKAIAVFVFGITGVFICLSILALAIKACGVVIKALARAKQG